jgi:transposase
MATISVDLRQRILKAYDRGDTTREQVASRFEVSLGMVKKLIQQRRHFGDIAPRHHSSGRKPIILDSHRRELRSLVSKQPDLTLEEIRARLGLACTIQAIHYVLADMGLTYKKRRSVLRSNQDQTSRARAGSGAKSKKVLIPHDLSSSTSPRLKRI